MRIDVFSKKECAGGKRPMRKDRPKRAESLCSEFWLRAKFRLEASRSFYGTGPAMFLRFNKPGNSMVSEPTGLNNQRNSATETPAKRLPSFQLLFVAEIEDADVADLQTLTVTAE